MDKEARCTLALKVVIDVAACMLMLWSFEMSYMVYMKDYHFTWRSVLKCFDFHGVEGFTELDYNAFERKCHESQELETALAAICGPLHDVKAAGMAYVVVSLVSILILSYNVLSFLGFILYFNCFGLLKFREPQVVVAPLYAFGVMLYVLISGVFSLEDPTGMKNHSSPDEGLFAMVAALLMHLVSLIYFLCIRTEIFKLEAAGGVGMQSLVLRQLGKAK